MGENMITLVYTHDNIGCLQIDGVTVGGHLFVGFSLKNQV